MAYYLVTAKPIASKIKDLRTWLDSREINAMRPFGHALQTGLDNARWHSDGVVTWEEEDYCVPPLAQECAAVLDKYFTNIEVEHVTKGEGWKKIELLKPIWETHDNVI